MEEPASSIIQRNETTGEAAVGARRIPVWRFIELKQGLEQWRAAPPDQFQKAAAFLELSTEQTAAALDYYRAHQDEIDEQIQTHHRIGSAKVVVVAHPTVPVTRLITVNLERAGHRVFTAANGADALEIIRSTCPHLVIGEAFMEPMNGFELLAQLRANLPLVLFILLYPLPQDDTFRFKVMAACPDASLGTPFSPRELLEFIRRMFKSVDSQYPQPPTMQLIDI